MNTVAAILNTKLGQIGLDQKGINEISKQIAEIGSLTVTNKQLDEKNTILQTEIDNLKKEEVHFKGSVKTFSDINGKLFDLAYVRGRQNDELDITIQEKETELKELNQSLLQERATIYEANLIAAFLVSPKGLDDYKLDKLVRLMVELRHWNQSLCD